jgi:NADPH-dependent curcumin reductase CurA
MNATVNRQILLVEKPSGKLGPEHFKLTSAAIPEPNDGEALLRVRFISLDAANRAWMHGATYRSAKSRRLKFYEYTYYATNPSVARGGRFTVAPY